jgi:serine/threonine-protein kinase
VTALASLAYPSLVSGYVDLQPAAKLDRYEIVREVATGGMGRVWLARFEGKHGFTKQVAIKAVLPELASNAQFRAMLLDEARICSRLEHPNVAQILDIGELGEVPYIVFEWVEGASLESICRAVADRGEAVPLGPLLRVMADVCRGLHAAHDLADASGTRLNVVHRDVTPHNIIVSRKGYAKLIDFGIAKARHRATLDTKRGVVKGTPQYMAPEQARGDTVDRRADVWAVGAVLYRALAGVPPFRDRVALEDFVRSAKALAPLPSGVPANVGAIVERAMKRDPGDRWSSADDLRLAIEGAMTTNDARGAIAELFPADAPLERRTPADESTQPEDIAFARTHLAEASAPPDVDVAMKPARAEPARPVALPSIRPPLSESPSSHIPPSLKIALAAMILVALVAVAALVFALLAP